MTRRLAIEEVGYEYEDVDSEERIIENPSLNSTTSRKLTLSREWTCNWEYGRDVKAGGSLSAKFGGDWGSVGATLSSEVTDKYAVKIGERHLETEEVSVEVQPGGRVKLVLTWKQRWQLCVATYYLGGEAIEVPFRVAKGLFLDQSVIDV
jgi:hypothetical protein